MAKQVTKSAAPARKRGAKSDSAKAENPRAVAGDNSKVDQSIAADDERLEAEAQALKEKAFADLVISEEADGTASERMAMAARIARRTIHDDTTPTFELAGKEFDKLKALVSEMQKHFGLVAPTIVDRNNRSTEERDAVRLYNSQRMLVENGVKLNVALVKCGIQDDAFDPDVGKWTIFAQALCKEGYRHSNPEMSMTLHRRAMYAMHTPTDANDKTPEIDRFFASVAQMIAVHCPANPAPRTTRGSQSQTGSAQTGGKSAAQTGPTPVQTGIASDGGKDKRDPWLARSDSFSGYCDAIARRLSGIGRGKGWTLTKGELTDAEWAAAAHAFRAFRRACQSLNISPDSLKVVETETENKAAA